MSFGAQEFMAGACVMACFVIGLKFLKYWKLSQDKFFIWFAAAFWTFGLGWLLRIADPGGSEHGYLLFLPRLCGFLMILVAILYKNRQRPA